MNMNTQTPHPNPIEASDTNRIPAIMCGIRDEPGATVLQLSPSLVPTGEGEVLYYPGCGTDYGPLVHFAQATRLKAVVYVDFHTKVADIKAMLHSACLRLGILAPEHHSVLKVSQLGATEWAQFWAQTERAKCLAGPDNGTGFQCELALPDGPVKFVFLRTEGHQTYSNLLNTALQPDIVVLQDHGFGGNWRDFGRTSPMYLSARQQNRLPPKLFVAEGTHAWPGYQRTEPYEYQEGQMHQFGRALFKRISAHQEYSRTSALDLPGDLHD